MKTKNTLAVPLLFAVSASCESSASADQSMAAGAAAANLVAAPASSEDADDGHVVTAKIRGLRNADGGVMAFLHGSEDTFPKKFNQAAHRARKRQLSGGSTSLQFRGVQPGTYAVVVFHDENGNGKMDKNFVGFPKEGIGASNVKKGRPSWSTAKFTVGQDMSVTVSMQYFGGDE
ncbi:MAG: DUF2141 domain-containing protein [Myxococcota bacterium]